MWTRVRFRCEALHATLTYTGICESGNNPLAEGLELRAIWTRSGDMSPVQHLLAAIIQE